MTFDFLVLVDLAFDNDGKRDPDRDGWVFRRQDLPEGVDPMEHAKRQFLEALRIEIYHGGELRDPIARFQWPKHKL